LELQEHASLKFFFLSHTVCFEAFFDMCCDVLLWIVLSQFSLACCFEGLSNLYLISSGIRMGEEGGRRMEGGRRKEERGQS
jgi:hypothetical protein